MDVKDLEKQHHTTTARTHIHTHIHIDTHIDTHGDTLSSTSYRVTHKKQPPSRQTVTTRNGCIRKIGNYYTRFGFKAFLIVFSLIKTKLNTKMR